MAGRCRLVGLRRWLDRAQLARSPRPAELNLPAPRGVLLVGVQGCGAEILRIHLGLRRQDPGRHDLAALAAAADGFSGAELEQVVISALLQSLHESRPLDDALSLAELRATVPLSRSP